MKQSNIKARRTIYERLNSFFHSYCEEYRFYYQKDASEKTIIENLKYELQTDFDRLDQKYELIDVYTAEQPDEWHNQELIIKDLVNKLK